VDELDCYIKFTFSQLSFNYARQNIYNTVNTHELDFAMTIYKFQPNSYKNKKKE
jgi:hypothetical protein